MAKHLSAMWILVATAALGVACNETVPAGKIGDACAVNGDCVHGLACLNGKCVLSTTTHTCVPGEKQCNGSTVEVCRADGSAWDVDKKCQVGCRDAECITPPCTPGAFKCGTLGEAAELRRCRADGSGEDVVQLCALGCDPSTTMCRGAACRAGARRCLDGTHLQVCKADGSDWVSSVCSGDSANGAICVSGEEAGGTAEARCVATRCTPDAQRCDGNDVVRCASDGQGEAYVQTCSWKCSGAGVCEAPACLPGTRKCEAPAGGTDKTLLRVCNSLGTQWEDTDCTTGGGGTCVSEPGAATGITARCQPYACQASARRCDGDRLVQCKATRDGEELVKTCVRGCDPVTLDCRPAECTAAGDLRCAPTSGGGTSTSIQICDSTLRWQYQQFCAAGCTADLAGTTPTAGGARCASPVCPPFAARCGRDPVSGQLTTVQRCRADGLAWDTEKDCTAAPINGECVDGACRAPAMACQQGRLRCAVSDLQRCDLVDGVSRYNTIGACLGACLDGACDAAGECGPFGLKLMLAAPGEKLPGDGRSTFLVLSDPITGPGGRAVPEGTLITVSVDDATVRMMSGDASPDLPGMQVAVVDGRIDFVVGAPAIALTDGVDLSTMLRAEVAGRDACQASLPLTFFPSFTDAGTVCNETEGCPFRYTAEDFTTTQRRDPQGGQRGWDTTAGTLSLQPYDAGDGRDGALVVDGTTDITVKSALGRAWADGVWATVIEIRGSDRLALDAADDSLVPFRAPGTRALLVNMQGNTANGSNNVGNWELVTIAGLENGLLRLAAPITRVYGEGGNLPNQLTGQAVRLVRVPQYTTVTVKNGGQLVASAWDGVNGGLLAFYAKDLVKVESGGRIHMDGRGYRGATLPNTPTLFDKTNTSCYPGYPYSYQIGAGITSINEYAWMNAGYGPPDRRANQELYVRRYWTTGKMGEGLDGQRDNAGIMAGNGSSGSGYACGSGDAFRDQNNAGTPPSELGENTNPANTGVTRGYFGSSGSHATRGNSSCQDRDSAWNYVPGNGAAQPYGDGFLDRIFMGGGSGSVMQSDYYNCYASRSCCDNAQPNWPHNNASSTYCLTSYDERDYVWQSWWTTWTNCRCTRVVSTGCGCWFGHNAWVSPSAGAPGGGIVVVLAKTIDLTPNVRLVSADGLSVTVNGTTLYGGAGGSVYLRAAELKMPGSGRIQAAGGPSTAAGVGRIRIDAGLVDSGFSPSWTTPTAMYVNSALLDVRSVALPSPTDRWMPTADPALLSAVWGVVLPVGQPIPFKSDGTVNAQMALDATKLALRVSADAQTSPDTPVDVKAHCLAGSTDIVANPRTEGTPPACTHGFKKTGTPGTAGKKAKWYLSAPGPLPGSTRGMAFKFKLNTTSAPADLWP